MGDTTVECSISDEDERMYRSRRRQRRATMSCDGSVASSTTESTSSTKRASWEQLFEKMKKRTSFHNSGDTTTTDFWDGNNSATGTNRMHRSLSEDGPTVVNRQTSKRETSFRDDSFLCKLTVANTAPTSVNVQNDNNNDNNKNIEQQCNNNVGDCESAAFSKMRRRLS